MAGGTGTRLWPLSQTVKPKQFLDLVGVGKTMIQMTFERFHHICPTDHFVVVTLEQYKDFVIEQLPELPEENILCEPFKRNTAPCIALANAFIKQRDPDAITIVTPSDHLILQEEIFVECVSNGVNYVASHDALMTIGVKAFRPDTAFGYIQIGEHVDEPNARNIHNVKTFTEKPNAEMAQVFFDMGDFCWNSGVFIWQLSSIENAMRQHLPDMQALFDALDPIPTSYWNSNQLHDVYEECESISIDYGIMEKARNVIVSLTDAMWCDLGSWQALYEQSGKDGNGNAVLSGAALMKNSNNCLVRTDNENVCIVEGLNDYMVVQRSNVTVVCPKQSAPNVWRYVSEIKAERD